MQGHGRVTAESWVVGEILPLSCLKKKSFVIVTEKGLFFFFCLFWGDGGSSRDAKGKKKNKICILDWNETCI